MDHEQLVRCLLAERARVLGFTRTAWDPMTHGPQLIEAGALATFDDMRSLPELVRETGRF